MTKTTTTTGPTRNTTTNNPTGRTIPGTGNPTTSIGRTGTGGTRTLAWDQISTPGTYVCNWSGHLLRIPADGIENSTPTINIVGSDPLFVTKISDDPKMTITDARKTAASLDLSINF